MERRKCAVARGPFHATPIFAQSARGATVTDVDGNVFIDFASGIGVVNVGHCPDSVVQAICEQAGRFIHTSFNVVPYEGYVALAEKLNAAAPGTFVKKSFFANSGAEAVENAIKIARVFTGRPGVVCFDHAYHGRTYLAMTLTAKDKPYKDGFGPFNSDVYRSPFPYTYRSDCATEAEAVEKSFAQFRALIAKVGAEKIGSVIVEPLLGEGGFIPCPPSFAKKLSDFCRESRMVLIADEIQTGFGRTGHLFASHTLGIAPDLMVVAKGIGGGLPISGVVGRAEIMDAPKDGGIGGTFSGNPLACASALAVFDLFEKENLTEKARSTGVILRRRLERWREDSPFVGDVRGLGLMLGVEFVKDKETREPFPEAVKFLTKFGYERGVISMSAGTFGNVIRFLMPLVTTHSELNEGLDVLERGLKEISL
jgi:4-aminobutyrate aminotransferase/(S)-3-amino-2-methylpropionate transaminase